MLSHFTKISLFTPGSGSIDKAVSLPYDLHQGLRGEATTAKYHHLASYFSEPSQLILDVLRVRSESTRPSKRSDSIIDCRGDAQATHWSLSLWVIISLTSPS